MQKRLLSLLLVSSILSILCSQTRAQSAGNAAPVPTPGKKDPVTGTTSSSTDIGGSLSLQQAIALAIKNNLLINQADLQMQTNKLGYNQSIDNLLPYVGASASQNLNFGRSLNTYNYTYIDQQTAGGSYSANASLTLFNGFYLQNSIRQNKLAYDASKMDLQYQKDNITLSVILAYLQVLSSQDQLVIAKEQADIDNKQLERLTAQDKEGAVSIPSNLTDLKGLYAGDLVNIAQSANALETAKINLFQFLNVPYKRDVEYDRNAIAMQIADYTESSDSIYQTALNIIPNVKAADLRVRSYQKGVAAARGRYFPTLSFNAGVNTYYNNATTAETPTTVVDKPTSNYVTIGGTNYSVIAPSQNFDTKNLAFGDQFKNNRSTSIGLTLTVPILNFLQARNNVKQAKINLKNAEINANSTRLVLQQTVELAYQNMISSFDQYKAYIDQTAAYAESFRVTEIRFNEGVINSDVYVIAKNNIDRAKTNLALSKYIYLFRTKVLDYYHGRLNF